MDDEGHSRSTRTLTCLYASRSVLCLVLPGALTIDRNGRANRPPLPLAPAAMRQRPSAKQVAVAQVLLSRLQHNMASSL